LGLGFLEEVGESVEGLVDGLVDRESVAKLVKGLLGGAAYGAPVGPDAAAHGAEGIYDVEAKGTSAAGVGALAPPEEEEDEGKGE